VLAVRVIACLDVSGGRVVKGIRFANLRDAGNPAERAAAYAAQGVDELVLLDVSATPEDRGHGLATVRAVRAELDVPLTVGGGVRSVEDAAALLGAGADKVAVNSAALARPELLAELAARFGRQCVVLAVDAARKREGWQALSHGGRRQTGRAVVPWCVRAWRLGAGEILLTSHDRDGTRLGYDCELVAAVAAAVPVPVVASGGAAVPSHLVDAARAGASGLLSASILHDGDLSVGDLKRALRREAVEVRP
jgi:imidazole glycerol-phosphate synthase subunit HisF